MEVLQYSSDMLSPLTAFYNRLTVDVLHCYPVTEEEFALAMRGVTDNVKDSETLDTETAFVAMSQGIVLGFVHAGVGQIGDNREVEVGVIRFLGYERGERRAGQAVLEEAEAYLKARNLAQVFAFSADCCYPFYHLEYACLSDALDHVQALLGFNGYRRHVGEVFMDWTDFSVSLTPADVPITFSVDWKQDLGELPNCDVFAHLDGEQVGVCGSFSGGRFSRHPDAQDWLVTVWLDVYDEFQGQGIGRHLLQYSLQEMRKIGYRHAAISTNWENYRAMLFYGNCGYRVVDWAYEYHKKLELN
jgi:GNAT superfamily N-acetyltransferase